jgi:hypothetical protein
MSRAKYEVRTVERLIDAVARGDTLRRYATGANGRPSLSQVHGWMRAHPDFAKTLREAEEFSARMFEEEALDLSREGVVNPDKDRTAAVRALNEQLRWSAERRDPSRYGNTAKTSVVVPVQIITSLNLGQAGASSSAEEKNIYEIAADNIVEVPFSEIKALPPPPPGPPVPRKRVLEPRNPFWTATEQSKKAERDAARYERIKEKRKAQIYARRKKPTQPEPTNDNVPNEE